MPSGSRCDGCSDSDRRPPSALPRWRPGCGSTTPRWRVTLTSWSPPSMRTSHGSRRRSSRPASGSTGCSLGTRRCTRDLGPAVGVVRHDGFPTSGSGAAMRHVDLNHEVHGPPDGPPVVLVHSLGMALGLWNRLSPALVERFRVVRLDL